MKAIVLLDVPDYQIGQPVSIYFKDTMVKHGICEKAPEPVPPNIKQDCRGIQYVCGVCGAALYSIYDTASAEYKIHHGKFCPECGWPVKIG